jgi:hypothetical protein
MTKIYKVNVMNRFEDDHITEHFFTTREKAENYMNKVNAKYKAAEEAGEYDRMVNHVNEKWGIEEIDADEEI